MNPNSDLAELTPNLEHGWIIAMLHEGVVVHPRIKLGDSFANIC